MALSINDFASATAYHCGNKKECQELLKSAGLTDVKMYSMLDAFKKGSKSSSPKTKEKSTTY